MKQKFLNPELLQAAGCRTGNAKKSCQIPRLKRTANLPPGSLPGTFTTRKGDHNHPDRPHFLGFQDRYPVAPLLKLE